jgi:hypothetical protein
VFYEEYMNPKVHTHNLDTGLGTLKLDDQNGLKSFNKIPDNLKNIVNLELFKRKLKENYISLQN